MHYQFIFCLALRLIHLWDLDHFESKGGAVSLKGLNFSERPVIPLDTTIPLLYCF